MFLETVGIAMIIPLISVITSGNFIYENEISKSIIDILGNPPREKILILTMILIVIVFVIKNLIIGSFIWWQYNFAHKLQLSLSSKLYENYLNKNFLFHIRTNSSELIRNTSNEPNSIRNAIIDLFTIIADLSIIIGLICLLIYYDPNTNSFIIGSLIFISLVFFLLTRNRVKKWGLIRLKMSGQSLKDLTQGYSGIKEIKILGKENFFLKIFVNNLKKLVNMNILNGFVKALPKLFLELLGIFILFLLILILTLNTENSIEKIITSLSLFALSIFKILPSLVRILSSAQNLRFRMAAIELLSNEFKNFEEKKLEKINELDTDFFKKEPSVLEVKNLNFSYPQENKKGLKDISFKIKNNSILGIFGASGSGKSTLINLILGLIKPDKGKIIYNENDISQNLRSWQSIIGLIPQNIYLVDDKIKNNIALGVEENEIDIDLLDRCIKMSELDKFISNLPQGIDTIVGERGARISGGELQRIGIARALYRNPKILILDEATSSLDTINEKKIMDTIESIKESKIVILISHRQSVIEYCTNIIEIKNGTIKLIK
tara:strand:- start:577 stop:2226 length:1650 start_codon:yes stop_codon:yes gene_type:complete